MKKGNFKFAFVLLSAIIVSLGLSISIQSLLAWTAPANTPPGGNVDAPVNIGSGAQVKSGVFGVTNDFYVGLDTFYVDHMGTGNVGIGKTNPTYALDINSKAYDGGAPSRNYALRLSGEREVRLEIDAASDDPEFNPLIMAHRFRGTIASPANVQYNAATQSGDTLIEIYAEGYYNSSLRDGGSLRMDVDGAPGAAIPSKWFFDTSESDGTVHSMVFNNKGNLGIGTLNPNDTVSIISNDPHINIGFSSSPSGDHAALEFSDASGVLTNRFQFQRSTENMILDYNYDGDANGSLVVKNNQNPVMTVTNSGNVGVGVSGPSSRLSIKGDAAQSTLNIASSTGAHLLSVDADGRLQIGDFNSSWRADLFDSGNVPNGLVISGTNKDMALVSVGSGDGGKADIDFYRAVGASIDSPGNVTASTGLGNINFHPYYNGSFSNGTQIGRTAAISASMDGTPSATSLPSKFSFSTTNIGSIDSSVKMTIKNDGSVGIGTSGPSQFFHLSKQGDLWLRVDANGTSRAAQIEFGRGSANNSWVGPAGDNTWDIWTTENVPMLFGTNAGERMRITGTGNVGIGASNPVAKLEVNNGDIYINKISGKLIMKSPDGTCSSCGPNNSDVWACASVTCP